VSFLGNDYYVGVVLYDGKVYEGRHETLTTPAIFEQMQTVLDSQRTSGERSWRHHHYLSGALYCGSCGTRLVYTQARGRNATYEYFVCMGRPDNCEQPHHRVEAVEQAVMAYCAKVTLPEAERVSLRKAMEKFIDAQAVEARRAVAKAKRQLDTLERQEEKLLAAHYDDLVSDALFASENTRIRRERAAAQQTMAAMEAETDALLVSADDALELFSETVVAYDRADKKTRKLFNIGVLREDLR